MGGKASAARIYPDELRDAIVLGLKHQLVADGVISDRRSIMEILQEDILG